MHVVRQRRKGDCGVAALATYLGQTYEDVYAAVAAVDKRAIPARGLYLRDLERAAKRFGVALARRHRPDVDEDGGVLSVLWAVPGQKDADASAPRREYRGHYVVLRDGRIYDVDADEPEGVPARDWLAREYGRTGHLLTIGRQ